VTRTPAAKTASKPDYVPASKSTARSKTVPLTGTPLEDLDLSVRSYNVLKKQGIDTAEGLAGKTAKEVKKYRGIGKESLEDIRIQLGQLCLALADEHPLPYLPSHILELPIEDLDLRVLPYNKLKMAGINRVGELLNLTEADLMAFKNFTDEALNSVKTQLATKLKLSLRQA
jgi:DNA-directed RNA polymerase alpha subunit